MTSIKKLQISSLKKQELIDITNQLKHIVKEESIKQGFLLVYNPHTTAAITINEGADPDVKKDILNTLSALVPNKGSYLHAEGNSDAHIKSSILGSSEMIIIEDNELILGTWQHVFFFEGDGPRNRSIYVKIVKEL
jgi:secondary thiamine-phosphate synthase enzyme